MIICLQLLLSTLGRSTSIVRGSSSSLPDWNVDGNADASPSPSLNNIDFKEFKFSQTDLTPFTAFQLKIVLTGSNSSYPPLLKDMRGIALAV